MVLFMHFTNVVAYVNNSVYIGSLHMYVHSRVAAPFVRFLQLLLSMYIASSCVILFVPVVYKKMPQHWKYIQSLVESIQ
jgi:hypothetical protein